MYRPSNVICMQWSYILIASSDKLEALVSLRISLARINSSISQAEYTVSARLQL